MTSKDETLKAWLKGCDDLIESGVATDLMAICPVALRRYLNELIDRRAAETTTPRYLRPSMGTASMFSTEYKMAVSNDWCRGWNALLSALEAAGCEADPNSPWPPLVPCPDCNGTGEVCVGHSGRDDDGNAPLLEPCDTCDRYGRIAPDRAELKTPATLAPLWSGDPPGSLVGGGTHKLPTTERRAQPREAFRPFAEEFLMSRSISSFGEKQAVRDFARWLATK